MSIFVFLVLLLASLICCTNAEENRNNEEILYGITSNEIPAFRKKRDSNDDGRETEQNPNDPKYKEIAKEIVYYHLRIKKEDARKITVTKVTTQALSGMKYKIQFKVLLKSGKTVSCDSETWEPNWRSDKKIKYMCNDSKKNPENENNSGTEQTKYIKPKDVDQIKYRRLAKDSVKNYINNLPANIEIKEIDTKSYRFARTNALQQLIYYVNLDVIVRDSNNFVCSVVFLPPNTDPLNTKCTEKHKFSDGIIWADPSKKKYLDLAEKSLLKGQGLSLTLSTNRHDTIVTFVTRKAVKGYEDSIDFIVRPVRGDDYECHSRVREKSNGQNVVEEVNCHLRKDEQEDTKPPFIPDQPNEDENEFYKHAKESVRDYLSKKQLVTVGTNIKSTGLVTTPVQQQIIMYVNLDVTTTHSSNYTCSVVFVLPNAVPLNTECVENRNTPDGNHWADPSTNKYIALAEKSLEIKQERIFASKHDTIVIFVVRQVVSGLKYTIKFIVRLIDNQEYECHSHVLENLKGQVVIEEVTCHPRGSIKPEPKPNDPNEQIYRELGKAYIRIHLPPDLEIIDTRVINIAYVTTPVHQQQIMYINYELVVRDSNNYICSVLFEPPSSSSLSTKCIEKQNTPGGIQWDDPSKQSYLNLAVQSLLQNKTLIYEIGTSRYDTIVTFVVQQVFSGYKDTIDFIIRSENYREYECHSLVWEKTTRRAISEGVSCHLRGANPPKPKPHELLPPHYKEIYSRIALDDIKKYITQLPGRFDIVDTKIKNIAIVKTPVHQHQILYINYDVAVRPSSNYICSVLFVIPNNTSLSTKCIEDHGVAGGYYWVDPSKTEYLDLANQWLTVNKNGVSRHDTIITFVVQQVVSGYKNTIDFIVLPEAGQEYKCQSHVWQTTTGVVLEDGKCDTDVTPNDPEEQDFDYSKYIELGSSSAKIYMNNLPRKLDVLGTDIINIAIVTPPVYPQKILYLNYYVDIRDSSNYICSVVFELPSHNPLSTNCIENKNTPGGKAWVDPSLLKYYEIAVDSLSQDKTLVHEIGTGKYAIIVTFVVQQADSEYKDRIDVIVRSIDGLEYDCHSDVWEKATGKVVIERVSCSRRGSNPKPKPNDVNEQIYPEIGKSYIRIHLPLNLEILEARVLNIAYVTAPVHRQQIMYINYEVIVRNSNKYICSVLFAIPTRDPLSTKCLEIQNRPGGRQWDDPSKPTYLDFAKKSIPMIQKKLVDKLSTGSYDTIVTFVIRKVASGYKDTIDFIIRSLDGHEYECRSNVWEKLSGKAIIEDVTCKPRGQGELEPSDPNLEIYKDYLEPGKKSLQIYFTPGKQDIEQARILNIVNVTTRFNRKQILYINYDVTLTDSSNYICTVVFVLPSQESISTNCIEKREKPGGFYWVDPSKTEYLDLAEKSLSLQTEPRHTSCVTEHDTIVTFVVQQVVSGRNDRLDFIVQPRNGQEYECQSNVWEKYVGQTIIDDLNCRRRENQNDEFVLMSKKVQKPVRQEVQTIKKTNTLKDLTRDLAKEIIREYRKGKKRAQRLRG